MPPQLTIVVSSNQDSDKPSIVLTTWGVRQGRYGSLGRVKIEGYSGLPAESIDDLARLVLTALYGMDYDL